MQRPARPGHTYDLGYKDATTGEPISDQDAGARTLVTAPAERRVYDACFAAGWATTGALLGAVGGWWALLCGPFIVVATVLGVMRYGAVRRG